MLMILLAGSRSFRGTFEKISMYIASRNTNGFLVISDEDAFEIAATAYFSCWTGFESPIKRIKTCAKINKPEALVVMSKKSLLLGHGVVVMRSS
jgi:hypothetical protein